MFDINGTEALVLLVLALGLVGPARLPDYARQLGRLARRVSRAVGETKDKVEGELGVQRGTVDWDALDPRRYDPRRIVRDALADGAPTPLASTLTSRMGPASAARPVPAPSPHPAAARPASRDVVPGEADTQPPARHSSHGEALGGRAAGGPAIVERGDRDGEPVQGADRDR
ncbi:MAG: twin-arginine translocase TatA/TatE family subunit [Bifidobacteriaceae bacterium]|nr:twin-arginine translocase TatA/TatE family subunit [Bifidobacteriaceae bacterium]